MNEQKFFKCPKCGNVITIMVGGDAPMTCCDVPMQELTPNTVEAATEKHIPDVSTSGRLVHAKIGSVPHPMTEEHHISFIHLQTKNGGQTRTMELGKDAAAMFAVLEDHPVEVFAYCNLHGLWSAKVPCDCGCEHTETETDTTDDLVCSAEFEQGCK